MPESRSVRERPILFTGDMVRSILEGRKTQTHRPLKPQPEPCDHACWPEHPHPQWKCDSAGWYCAVCGNGTRLTRRDTAHIRCPLGRPGDRLWVREAALYWTYEDGSVSGLTPVVYQDAPDFADCLRDAAAMSKDGFPRDHVGAWKRRPSIHMPRWASRLTLEVTYVRIERAADISEEDAVAEGFTPHGNLGAMSARDWFALYWQDIYGKTFPWDSNPWVWVVEFRRIDAEVSHA